MDRPPDAVRALTFWLRDIVPTCTPKYPVGARRGEGGSDAIQRVRWSELLGEVSSRN